MKKRRLVAGFLVRLGFFVRSGRDPRKRPLARLGIEPLERRLATAALSWNNPYFREDVNGDALASALDALVVINDLNTLGSRALTAPPDTEAPRFLDVSNDGWVSPIDALLVINSLNFASPYSVNVVQNVVDEKEYRLLYGGFHFATVFRQGDTGIVAARFHPDQRDANGWGSTLYVGPFIAGADASSGKVNAVQLLSGGIRLAMSGEISSPGNTMFGSWSWNAMIQYDVATEAITTQDGELSVVLPDEFSTAAGDLNLYRIHSNLLQDVPRQFRPDGDTGDTNRVEVAYAPQLDPRNFTWRPQQLPAHYPNDAANYLSVVVVGEFNDVDPRRLGLQGEIAPAFKPTLSVELLAEGGVPITFGGYWDTNESRNPYSDNVGITPLLKKGTLPSQSLSFEVRLASYPIERPA
jgi:hypothetical protein